MKDPVPAWGEELEVRLTDLVIRLVVLGLLVHWSLELLRPFAPIFIWAAILAVALAPVHRGLARRLGDRSRLAAVLLCLGLFLLLIGPVAALVESFVATAIDLGQRAQNGTLNIPAPPKRLDALPVVGTSLSEAWTLAATNLDEALVRYRSVLRPVGASAISVMASVGVDLVRLVLAVIVTGFLLVGGGGIVNGARLLARRLVPPRGGHFVDLAGATVRNVAQGVVGVALLQTILIGLTFQIAGVPGAGLLAFLVLVLCVIQIGPAIVVLPVIVWGWLHLGTLPALALTVVLVALTVMDNVLKPIVMGRGLSTPTLVVFLGVIGGTVACGLTGLFLGPIVLGVFHDLLTSWMTSAAPNGESEG